MMDGFLTIPQGGEVARRQRDACTTCTDEVGGAAATCRAGRHCATRLAWCYSSRDGEPPPQEGQEAPREIATYVNQCAPVPTDEPWRVPVRRGIAS